MKDSDKFKIRSSHLAIFAWVLAGVWTVIIAASLVWNVVLVRWNTLEAARIQARTAPDKFDMVVTDMAMPNMPGDKLSAELIKIRSDIPILICTGFSETLSEEKAISLGIKGFLLKPINRKSLSQKIREVLDNSFHS